MTYQESSDLMNDFQFRGRIRVACLRYADVIFSEAPSAVTHTTRMRWAGDCFRNSEAASALVHPAVCMDPQVQLDGAAIADPQLQLAVEKVINELM